MGERVIPPRRVLVGGGIGAGKSAVLDALGGLGYATIQADRVGHSLLDAGGAAEAAVGARWPSVVVDGRIERAALGAIVFSDVTALRELESITHPLIVAEIERRASSSEGPLAVEIPLIGLLGADDWFRIAVVAPEDLRVERAVERGGDESDIRDRLQHQPSEAEWRGWADAVIENDGSLAEISDRVRQAIGGPS